MTGLPYDAAVPYDVDLPYDAVEAAVATFGVDYSYSRDAIDIPAMARDGVKFACRYLRDGATTGKALLPAEAVRLHAAGIAIVANDETTGTQLLGGLGGGARDARAALAAAQACGMPEGRPIYFTPWDHDPATLTADQWNLLGGYADGVISVLGVERVGWYGGTQMLRWLKAGGRGRWWWQSLGWRQGVWLDWVHLQQYDNGNQRWNGQVDYDRALQADYGQWSADMNQEEHDALMWLRANAVTLKDQGVHLNDHGNQTTTGAGNHHKAIRADIADLAEQVTALQAAVAALQGGGGVVPTLEGSAMINLVVSPVQP